MVFLPFLPKKNFLCSLLIFLSLFFSIGSLYSQVKIKEKVAINPISPRLAITTNYSPIEFLFNGSRPYSVAVSGPGATFVSGSCAGYSTPLLLLTTPAINGTYQVSISSGEDYVSTVGFSVTWVAPDGNTRFLAGYEMAFYFGGTRTATFTFNEIPPPPPPFDFQISFDNPLAYANDRSLFIIQYNHDSEPQDKSVELSFAAADPDVVFFDEMLQEELGSSITASLDDYDRYSVTCKSLNSSFPKKVKVVGVSNGLQRSDTLTILQSEYLRAYFEKESLSPGDTVNIIVKKVNNKYGWESDYPDTTHFEVGIKEGCGLGMIMDAGGIKRDYFSGIQLPIRFVVADSIGVDTDSVVLRVGAPIVEEGDVVASSVIPTGNNLQKNKNAVNQNMNISTALDVNRKFIAKAANNDYCVAGNYTYTNVDFPVGKIGGDCDSAPKCDNEIPKAPIFIFKPNDVVGTYCNQWDTLSNGRKVPKIGGVYFNNDNIEGVIKPFAQFDINVCYNNTLGLWIIKTDSQNLLTVQYDVFWCESNIKIRWNRPIKSVTGLNSISADSICKALEDLRNQYESFEPDTTHYVISEVTAQHEVQHTDDLKKIINDLYKSFDFARKYLKFKKSCKDINSIAAVKDSAQKYVKNLLKQFLNEEKSIQKEEWGTTDENDKPDFRHIEYEHRTQHRAFHNYGNKYMTELYNLGIVKGKEKCVKAIYAKYPGLFNRGNQ